MFLIAHAFVCSVYTYKYSHKLNIFRLAHFHVVFFFFLPSTIVLFFHRQSLDFFYMNLLISYAYNTLCGEMKCYPCIHMLSRT